MTFGEKLDYFFEGQQRYGMEEESNARWSATKIVNARFPPPPGLRPNAARSSPA